MVDQELVLVQPPLGEDQELGFVAKPGSLGAQGAYQCPGLVIRHPTDAQGLLGQLLMLV